MSACGSRERPRRRCTQEVADVASRRPERQERAEGRGLGLRGKKWVNCRWRTQARDTESMLGARDADEACGGPMDAARAGRRERESAADMWSVTRKHHDLVLRLRFAQNEESCEVVCAGARAGGGGRSWRVGERIAGKLVRSGLMKDGQVKPSATRAASNFHFRMVRKV